jgi:hypothetical protein
MPHAFPWPDDGDAAFLAALEAPRPKPNPLPNIVGAVAGAIANHERDYNISPVEVRMSLETARQMVKEIGFEATDEDLSDGAQIMGKCVSIDPTLALGEVVAWPTPDEKMWTEFRSKSL